MNRRLGITLLELLVALSILSILLAISMPNFRHLAQSVTADVTLRRLANAIQFAKAAAITSGSTVTLCRSENKSECGGRWRDGVIIFTDTNRNRKIDGLDNLLRHIGFPESDGDIQFRAFQNKQYLQITSLGTTHDQNGNFTYCPDMKDRKLARQLIVNRSARLRFAQDSDGDGIREDSRGRALRCD